MIKTIFITGASSGIGKATAEFFQGKGWNVVATMRNPQDGADLAAMENVLVARLDVLDLSSIEQAVKEAVDRFGRIDVLVNNAGYGAYGILESFPRESILRQFNTNVIGLLDVTRAVSPQMRAQKEGTIINISSIGGRMTFPMGSLYHGTKFAVEGISEALHFEMEQIGVKVKIVEPGAIATDFGGRSFVLSNDESLTEYQPLVAKMMAAMGAMGSNASPASVVAEVIWNAATDGTSQLRYTAGEDAKVYMENRSKLDDATFIGGMKQGFGL